MPMRNYRFCSFHRSPFQQFEISGHPHRRASQEYSSGETKRNTGKQDLQQRNHIGRNTVWPIKYDVLVEDCDIITETFGNPKQSLPAIEEHMLTARRSQIPPIGVLLRIKFGRNHHYLRLRVE